MLDRSLPMAGKIQSPWLRYGLALVSFAATLGATALLQSLNLKINLAILIIIALFLTAWYGGRWPGLLYGALVQGASIVLNPIPPDTPFAVGVFGYFSNFTLIVFIVLLISGRRKAEDELREQRELSDVTLSSIGDAVIACDIDGRIRFLNPTAEVMTGWIRSESAGKPIEEIFHIINEETRERVQSPFSVIKSKGVTVGLANHTALITKDGREIPIEDSGAPIRESEGNIIGAVIVFHDITEQKQAANALRQQALLIEQSFEAVFVWDFERGILEWNAGSEQLYGYSKEEAAGKMGYELLRTEFPVPVSEFLSELKAKGSWSGEVLQHTKDGHEVVSASRYQVFELDGRDIVLQTNRDITASRLAEQALRESEERYRYLFESNPFPMWVYDIETLAFLAVNDAASFYYGYSHEEFLSMTIRDIRPESDVPALLANIAQSHARLENADIWQHLKKDGTIIDVEVSSHELVFNGRPARLVLANDVTERRRIENALRQLNETLEQRVAERTIQLEDANKELEAFTYSVSHDLRAPLRAIDGFSRILVEDYADKLDQEGERVLSVIRNNAQNMGKLIDDLLEFSRLGRKPLDDALVDMNELARHVYEDLQPVSGAPSHTGNLIVAPLPPVRGDRSLLRQVFINLISNAIKYSRTKESMPIEVGGLTENGQNIYYVRDHGVGFDMKYVSKLFGVFQRLHSAEEFEGTGVGLAIVQRIISRHGGRVWAEGELGKGATFYFALPSENSDQQGDK